MAERITIAGDIGSGKTTVARAVAERLGVEPLSTGGIQRQLAAARGITTLELNKLAETDSAIDEEIDNYLKQLPGGDLTVESRMAWHFVPNTKKIFLYIVAPEAAGRILRARRNDEPYKSMDDAIEYISRRRSSEILRFRKYYGVNIDDLRNYDLVIDSTFASPSAIANRMLEQRDVKFRPRMLLSPRNLLPTQGVRELNPTVIGHIANAIVERGYDEDQVIRALYVNHTFFIADGHNRAAAAIKTGLDFVPVALAAAGEEQYISGLSAKKYVEDSITAGKIHDWEDAVGFQYEHEIWRMPFEGKN